MYIKIRDSFNACKRNYAKGMYRVGQKVSFSVKAHADCEANAVHCYLIQLSWQNYNLFV